MYICTKCFATLDAGERKCPICGGTAVRSKKASEFRPAERAPKERLVYAVKKCGTKETVAEFNNIEDARKAGLERGYYIEVILKVTKSKTV